MPVIRIQREELKRFGIDENEFIENIAMLGADLKNVGKEEIMVEFFPDRPDLYSIEGIARAIKGFLGYEKGAKKYSTTDSDLKVYVAQELGDIRPYFVGAIVKNLKIDELAIKSLMDFQEKLHITVGRKRKKLAVGLHDFDRVRPPFYYVAKEMNFSFEPLGFHEDMKLSEILERHPKGIEHGWLLKNFKKYPVIVDSEGRVLSFPPIINGNLTQITENTKNIFVDITGTDLEILKDTLNIIVTALADRGGEIYSVEILYDNKKIKTPQLNYRKIKLKKDCIEKFLGLEMSDNEISESLKRMRFDTKIGKEIEVTIPPYRMDILHPVDIIEDIAKGFRFDRIGFSLPKKYVPSKGEIKDKERLIMIALGFIEVTTLSLVSFKDEYGLMNIPREEYVVVDNPISEYTQTLRSWLIPSLMVILKKNKHRDLPQKIFEIGSVRRERMEKHLAFLSIAPSVSFTDCKSYIEAILRDLNVKKFEIVEKEHGSFIDGRCASIMLDDREIGFFGEIHPQVIENFELRCPVIGAEIFLDSIE